MKQSTKRIFAAALAALVVAAVGTTLTTQLPQLTNSVAYAATIVANGTCGAPYVNDGKNVTWELTDDGTLTISGTGAMRNYVNAGNDTADTPWKDYKNDIKKIVIGKEITSIGTYNFALLPNLENITFEENSQLKIIGRYAFYNSGFTNITIPASVTTIEGGAFVECSGLTSITLPSSVISIENRAFFYCTNLTTVTMESANPPTLEDLIFLNTSLNTISVPVDALNKYKNACDKGEKGWKAEYKNMLAVGGDCGAEGHESDVKWAFKPATGTLTISGTGAMKDYGIADTDTADTPWKDYKNDIKKIVIGKEITSIGTYNFALLPNLENITFEENSQLKIIGRHAFYNSGFTNITIPASVTTIDVGAFVACSSLTKVTFAKNSKLERIGTTAFSVCSGLTSITLPSSVISIENRAFISCANLTTVTMESSTPPTLGDEIFKNTTSLNTILVPSTALNNYKNADTEKGWDEYKDMLAVGGDCGAEGHESDVTWKLQNGTLTISGKGKMADYINLNDIPWVNYRDNINGIVIEKDVESIGEDAFSSCTGLTSVTFAENSQLESIGANAFDGCTNLTSITIPTSVTFIGDYAFYECTGLTSVTFAENSQLKIIGVRAFDGCTNLTSITIPTSVTSIGSYAFYECTGLTSVTFAENSQLESIGANAFDGCTNLTSITIPTSVTSIGSHAFKECIGLTSVTIPEKVTSIEGGVFYDCTGLTNITISEGVTKISNSMFSGATALKSITIPKSVTSIGSYAFKNCKALKNIGLPEELTKINQHAFVQSGLTGVTIPKSVDFIGIGAFSVCEQLDSVIMERETPCNVGPNIFGYENPGSLDTRSKFVKENTKGITVPYGSLEKYKSAENWSDYKNYMKEAPAPVSPAPSIPSQTTTQKPTTTDENGNTITGSITTYPDGSVVDTTIVTKPNGDTTTTVVEKGPQGNTTKTTETKVETAADGTKTETETVTEAGKAPVITKTVTKKDGSQTIEKITSAENSRGNTVTTTETTVKDSKGNVVKKTTKKEIKNIGNGTDAIIDVDNNTAIINKIGAAKPNGMQATINNKVLSQLKEANNGKDLLLTMIVKDKDGNKRYSVEVDIADLTPKNRLYIYKKDSKTGELYMVNGKAYITDSKGQLKLIIRSKGDFVLKNAEDAAKINEKILSTVQAKKNKATLAKGKTEFFAFHEDLDMRNVKSISYETSDPRIATVNETGKIKGKKAGTTTITATVTLKNGETKTVTMKVTVK